MRSFHLLSLIFTFRILQNFIAPYANAQNSRTEYLIGFDGSSMTEEQQVSLANAASFNFKNRINLSLVRGDADIYQQYLKSYCGPPLEKIHYEKLLSKMVDLNYEFENLKAIYPSGSRSNSNIEFTLLTPFCLKNEARQAITIKKNDRIDSIIQQHYPVGSNGKYSINFYDDFYNENKELIEEKLLHHTLGQAQSDECKVVLTKIQKVNCAGLNLVIGETYFIRPNIRARFAEIYDADVDKLKDYIGDKLKLSFTLGDKSTETIVSLPQSKVLSSTAAMRNADYQSCFTGSKNRNIYPYDTNLVQKLLQYETALAVKEDTFANKNYPVIGLIDHGFNTDSSVFPPNFFVNFEMVIGQRPENNLIGLDANGEDLLSPLGGSRAESDHGLSLIHI